MRPAELTPEAIVQAGRDLQATGCNITGFALHRKLGGGNPIRLKQVWDEHLAGQSVVRVEPVAASPMEVAEEIAEEVAAVTKDLTERLAGLVVEINDKAVRAAERRVYEVVRSAGEQREQAERELADAGRTVDDLEAKLDDAKAEADALQRRITQGIAVNRAQAVELAAVREGLSRSAQSAKTAGEQHAAELARLHVAIMDCVAERDQARAALQEAQGELLDLMRRTREQGTALDAELARLHAAIADCAAERDQAHAALQEAQGEVLDLMRRTREQGTALDSLRATAGEAERRAVVAEARAQRNALALEASQAAHAAAERVAADLRLEVAAERSAHVADLRAIIERLPSGDASTA